MIENHKKTNENYFKNPIKKTIRCYYVWIVLERKVY